MTLDWVILGCGETTAPTDPYKGWSYWGRSSSCTEVRNRRRRGADAPPVRLHGFRWRSVGSVGVGRG